MNNPQWIIDLFASIDDKNSDKFVSFLTEDSVFTFGNSDSAIGRVNIHEAVSGFFSSIKSVEHTALQTFETGEFTIVRGISTYKRHNDTILTVPFCNVFEMSGTLIQDYRIYIDLSQLYSG